MRALRDRPTALERWTSGVRPGMKLATSPDGQGRRRVLPEAGAQGRARLPRVRRDHLPLRADRRRDLPDRDRGAGVVRAHGDADLPPVAGPAQRRGPPRRAAHRPRPAAGHDVHRRRAGRRRRPRAPRGARAASASPRPRATAASTSSCGSSRAGSSSTSGTPRSASAASWPGATTASRWTGGRRSAGSGSSSTSTRTAATGRSPRPTRCGRSPAPPVSTPMTWEELAEVTDPRELNLFTVPERLAAVGRRLGDDRRHGVLPRAAAGPLGRAARRRDDVPARLPEDARRAAAGAAQQEGRGALGRRRQPDRPLVSRPAETRKGPPGASPRAPGREPFEGPDGSSPDEPRWVVSPDTARWRSFRLRSCRLALPPELRDASSPRSGARGS